MTTVPAGSPAPLSSPKLVTNPALAFPPPASTLKQAAQASAAQAAALSPRVARKKAHIVQQSNASTYIPQVSRTQEGVGLLIFILLLGLFLWEKRARTNRNTP